MDQNLEVKIEELLDAPSCYPEFERKPREQRKQELIEWYEKYNEVNTSYNIYGMDRADSPSIHEWLDRGIFRKQRHNVNAVYYPDGSAFPCDYILFMRDKYAFEMLMRSIYGDGPEYCKSYGIYSGGRIYANLQGGRKKDITIQEFMSEFEGLKVVFKNTFGCSGSDV